MPDALAIGLNVNEREVADTPVIVGPPIGQSGWVFQSPRGPLGVAVQLNSTAMSKRVFGGANKSYNNYYCLRGLFKNAGDGGAVTYGSRVVNITGVSGSPATVTTTNTQNFAMAAGQTLVVDVDNTGDQTATFDATAGAHTGAAVSYPVTAAAEELNFTVDGGDTINVVLGTGSMTLNDVIAAVVAAGTGFTANANGGQLRIISDKLGTGSNITIAAGTANTLLGLTAASYDGTGDVVNIAAVTGAEVKTLVEADITGVTVTVEADGSVRIDSDTTGITSELDIDASSTALTSLGLTAAVTTGAAATGTGPTQASKTFQRGSTNVWTFSAGYKGYNDPGTWANGLVYISIAIAPDDATKRDVAIGLIPVGSTAAVQVEMFPGLDATNIVSKINSPTNGSDYVKTNIEGGDLGVPDATNGFVLMSSGTAGTDGTVTPVDSDYSTRLKDFNGLLVQVVGNLDLDDYSWAVELESYCTGRGDVLGIFQTLQSSSISGIKAEFIPLLKAKSFVAGYRSYAKVSDEFGGSISVPVIAHVVGAGYVRKAREAGNLPHIAPAGQKAFLLDVLDVEDSVYGPQDLKDLVNGCNVNPVVFETGKGFFAKTSRTMSTATKHVSIHVRLLTNHIKVAFRDNLGEFEQEGNSPETRDRLRDGILGFMTDLDGKGAFEKTGGFENNVAVVCDSGNNPINVISQRRMVCDVTFRPVEIAEDVQINVIQTRDGIDVSDS